MKRKRTLVVAGLAAAALAVGGAGIAKAVSGSGSGTVEGPTAKRAARAAVEAVGGGHALEVEYQDGDARGVYEVEVRRTDGSHVEVHLNGQFESVGTQADDDAGDSGSGDN
jgi:Peptidase propeptide and YPEB domain